MATSLFMHQYLQRGELSGIYGKVMEGKRLSFDDGLALWKSDDLTAIGALANIVRENKNGNDTFYVRNQHINYTNLCNKGCKFCSFYAQKDGPSAYTMSMEQVRQKLERTRHLPVTEIHMVAGINKKLPYSYYLELLDTVKATRPEAHIKAFTMVELLHIQTLANKPMTEMLLELKAHGLCSLPGGGAEILTDRVHDAIFPRKETAAEWLETAKTAHRAGLHTNATMLYGHIETLEERVIHTMKLREAQDETGGFLTFIPLAFSSKGTKLSHIPSTTGYLDLKAIAIGRLMLDNFPHIKAFWMMITPPVAQTAQWYGADDIDGTIVEYTITHEIDDDNEGQNLSQRQLVQMIVEAGRDPVERDPLYNVIERDDSRAVLEDPRRLALPMLAQS
ncbi:aminofutalosine synthase MqnE [Armatimonas rosea]|uniref:Aminodeoxyfutalosine synthase n=1 Tax=Armatimonas rosea TaxID=685828 RepID=A0A7W9SKG8_ARMRO|nr:aminofutalosine synthase MqnE [Armatimonas rosea]MBB6048276.1 aminodeoxyfutalosine synthase [Armatimonas rosea]